MLIEKLKWIYRAYRYRYRLEREEIRLLLEHLGPGEAAVDVGAHKGAYTYWMRRAVGAGGSVYAFEPQPQLAARLLELVRAGAYDNIVVKNLGISSAEGTMPLNVPGGRPSPGASLEEHRAGEPGNRSYPVDVTTLDAYFEPEAARRDRLIKCDVEGHELEVFRGAERTLREGRPCLLFECERRHRESGRLQEVFDYLENLGYRGFFISREGTRPVAEFDPELHQADNRGRNYANNFLFLATLPLET